MSEGHRGFLHDRLRLLDDELLSVDAVDRSLEQARTFRVSEPALIHPFAHSVVKLRNNGMIDIMVEGNTGVRVDPATQSINLIAEAMKVHGTSMHTWLTGEARLRAAGAWTVESDRAVNIRAPILKLDVPPEGVVISGTPLPTLIRKHTAT